MSLRKNNQGWQILDVGLSLSFESPIALGFKPVTTCNFVSKLCQQQASSPVTSRTHQGHSTVTGVKRYNPNDRPDM